MFELSTAKSMVSTFTNLILQTDEFSRYKVKQPSAKLRSLWQEELRGLKIPNCQIDLGSTKNNPLELPDNA